MNKKIIVTALILFGTSYAMEEEERQLLTFTSSDDDASSSSLDNSPIPRLNPPPPSVSSSSNQRRLVRSASMARREQRSSSFDEEIGFLLVRENTDEKEEEVITVPVSSSAPSRIAMKESLEVIQGISEECAVALIQRSIDALQSEFNKKFAQRDKKLQELDEVQDINCSRIKVLEDRQSWLMNQVASYLPSKQQFITCAVLLVAGGYVWCNQFVGSDHSLQS